MNAARERKALRHRLPKFVHTLACSACLVLAAFCKSNRHVLTRRDRTDSQREKQYCEPMDQKDSVKATFTIKFYLVGTKTLRALPRP